MTDTNYLLSVRTNGGIFHEGNTNSPFSQQEIHGDDFSLNESIIALQSLWRTEHHSPIILPYPRELIEEIQEGLQSQQEYIDGRVDKGDETEYFTITLYQMEIDRVRFSLVKYLRTRIQKIEQQVDFLILNTEAMDRLSDAEQVYLSKLNNINNQLINDTIINRLASESAVKYFRINEDRYKHSLPNLDTFVFCQALVYVPDLEISAGVVESFSPGNIFVARFGVVQDAVLNNFIQLL